MASFTYKVHGATVGYDEQSNDFVILHVSDEIDGVIRPLRIPNIRYPDNRTTWTILVQEEGKLKNSSGWKIASSNFSDPHLEYEEPGTLTLTTPE